MKYLIVLGLLIFPLVSKAQLAGFLDGNMYDPVSGTWQCQFLMDGNCYSLDQKILMTRTTTPDVTTSIPVSTPNTVYVPVYVSPIGGGGEPSVPIIPPSVNPVISLTHSALGHGESFNVSHCNYSDSYMKGYIGGCVRNSNDATDYWFTNINSTVPVYIKSFQYTLKNKGNDMILNIHVMDGTSTTTNTSNLIYNGMLPENYNQTGEYIFKYPDVFYMDDPSFVKETNYKERLTWEEETVPEDVFRSGKVNYDFQITQITYQVKGDDTDQVINIPLP